MAQIYPYHLTWHFLSFTKAMIEALSLPLRFFNEGFGSSVGRATD
tara:strand:- start:3196 stop:3330 length:135 start_codon:yes stop_codon:yes gene_type:complete